MKIENDTKHVFSLRENSSCVGYIFVRVKYILLYPCHIMIAEGEVVQGVFQVFEIEEK